MLAQESPDSELWLKRYGDFKFGGQIGILERFRGLFERFQVLWWKGCAIWSKGRGYIAKFEANGLSGITLWNPGA
jgi:hypothetical protein